MARLSLPAMAFLLAMLPAGALAQVRAVELYAPRPFGYVIGDEIAHEVEIALDEPYTIDGASLPQPRPLNYWLDLARATLEDRGSRDGVRRYTLRLVYQTFYAPLEPKRLDIPALALAATDGTRRADIAVPSWSFLTSPLREVMSTAPGEALRLRPDIAPRPIPTAGLRAGLLASLAIAALGFVALAWKRGLWPFSVRRRPFRRAARQVHAALAGERARSDTSSTSSVSSSTSSAYRAALLALHRAFDATAGRGVLKDDLPRFFAEHPAFAAAGAEVDRLFDASRRAFFGSDAEGAMALLPPERLAETARRLRRAERGAP